MGRLVSLLEEVALPSVNDGWNGAMMTLLLIPLLFWVVSSKSLWKAGVSACEVEKWKSGHDRVRNILAKHGLSYSARPRIIPTTSLGCVAKIFLCKIAGLRSLATRVSGVLDSHNSLCLNTYAYKCRCRVMSVFDIGV
jgi:hypothetical protein